jgi:hypothetical protein
MRRLPALLLLIVAVASGCTPCADFPTLGVDGAGVPRVFGDLDSRMRDAEVVGMSRWVVVRRLGPTPWSEGGFLAVATDRWGETTARRDGPSELVLLTPRSLAFRTPFACPAPDPVPDLGTVLFRPVFAQSAEPPGAPLGPDALLPVPDGTSEREVRAAIDQLLGDSTAVGQSSLPLDGWERRVERPRALLTLVLSLAALGLAVLSVRVTRDDLRAGAARPFPSLWSAVVWTVTAVGLIWLGTTTVDWLSGESMIDTQPNDALRIAGGGLALVGLTVVMARPWFPAASIVCSMTALVAATALTLGAGPWLVAVPGLVGAARLRRSDLVDRGRVAAILGVGTVAIGGTVLSGWGLWVGGFLLVCCLVVGGAAAPMHQPVRRPTPPGFGATPADGSSPDATVGHPGG